MKNQIKNLSIAASLILLFLISAVASAQNTVARERITPVQSGTITLVNGKANVELNQQVQNALNDAQSSSTYIVIFTPYEGTGSISLLEKSNNKFSVASLNVAGAKADYVVFLKQTFMVPSSTDNSAVIAK
jgi:hypothetical protein